jgi:glutathione S-transferase
VVVDEGLGLAFEDRLEPFTKPDNYDEFRASPPRARCRCCCTKGGRSHDSMGIALYLADRHDGVWPKDPDARAWAQCAAAEMHSGFSALRNDCTMNVGVRVKPKPMSDALTANVARIRELWEEGLARFGGPYLAGPRFSAVDAFFAPVAYRVRTYGLDVGKGGGLGRPHHRPLSRDAAMGGRRAGGKWREAAMRKNCAPVAMSLPITAGISNPVA